MESLEQTVTELGERGTAARMECSSQGKGFSSALSIWAKKNVDMLS